MWSSVNTAVRKVTITKKRVNHDDYRLDKSSFGS